LSYRGKIKLHGSCAGVSIQAGRVYAISRRHVVAQKNDCYKWRKFVMEHQQYFLSLSVPNTIAYTFKDMNIFGEWAGEKIQKGAAVCSVKIPIFGVFAISLDHQFLIVDPELIQQILSSANKDECPSQIHVLPWVTPEYSFDFHDILALQQTIKPINEFIQQVDAEDPWIKEKFNISGTGEGVVFFPVGYEKNGLISITHFKRLAFKAKGEHHSVYKGSDSLQIYPELVQDVNQFVEQFVTQNRLEQGLHEVCGGTPKAKQLEKFQTWMIMDIKKESDVELKANGMEFNRCISCAIISKASMWFESLLAQQQDNNKISEF